MLNGMRYFIMVIGFLLVAWIGWKVFNHFFDSTVPSIVISGLDDGKHYCGDAHCGVVSNKTGELSVSLDDQPLLTKFKMKANHEHTFAIPTRTLSNGVHHLRITLVDTTFNNNKQILERTFKVDNVPLQGAFVTAEAENKVFQGRTLRVQFQVNKEIDHATIETLSHIYHCFPESKSSSIYECYIPIECEENANEYLMTARIVDHVGNTLQLDNKFQVMKYPFKKQMLAIADEKVEEEKSLGFSAAERQKKCAELAQNSPHEKLWRGTFCTPIDIARITCDFGTIRTTKHKGRYMHKALDVANAPKSVIWAPQSGIVVLKERYEDAGNTVIIDHGWGVLSLFYHLDTFADVAVGQMVAQGNPIGTIGKTGHATGYHLHWEMRVNDVAVDPMQWTTATF